MSDKQARPRRIAIAITGASGAIYATRTIAALMDYLVSRYGAAVRNGSYTRYSTKDLGAKIASGSQDCEGMVVVPCSMTTLAGIAHGLSRNEG